MNLPELLQPYKWRIIGVIVGLVIAVLFMTIGFGYTLLLLLIAGIGFLIGKWKDGQLDINDWLKFLTK
ncbi:hypothetical protein PWEIH_06611 [Listeria weihenstephanensis FSL R9-0317]|uniref:DUF2273 domain-containing protein n=1 Tax=Listeria weihenstephanensis TaxID=1006155 RepID=A0A1S7FQE4_9LIST|nr:DUF2273 domain-containing protein [Listeria weihenstephanensis]AQY49646.1 hypothetical protein UE46_00235 [Listeria weihenstephanensis]EUJ39572.1 hypothetical protein PWEIH_06611 [Listeria weihenstephanensis FSL R9-0317]MBC1499151.1 DUF2273 domain-containing protein [Listeria weihenstephanensis]